MGAKIVRTTSAMWKWDERKVLSQPFTPCIVDVQPYKNISLSRYRVPQKTKTVKFLEVVPKRKAVLTEMLLCRAIFKNVLGLLIEDDL